MNDEELKELEKDVKRFKRIASERASELHDLVEDRLPAGFEDIPRIAQATYDACRAWADANSKLQAATKNASGAASV